MRGLDVLEIGVGFDSDHSQITEQKPKTLTGIDLTERAIENTKTSFKVLGLKSLLHTDNADALSFDSNSFDAVYSWGVLHHSPNTEKCFEEVWRVLRPNGFKKMIYHKNARTGWMLLDEVRSCKYALEILQEILYFDNSLRVWFDRN